jgi:SAM-dependent methyltransferase
VADQSDAASFRVSGQAYDLGVGRYGQSLGDALIEFTGLPATGRVLDVGCGPGALSERLAERVGPERVAAVDPSQPFVEACRRRLPGAEVRLGRAEDLPFEDSAFGATFSQLVVNFLTDPEQGASEVRRVTRPGGVVCACVWDYGGEMVMLRAFWDAAVAVNPGAVEQDEGRRMPYSRPEELEALWRQTGLRDIGTGAINARAAYRDFEDFWSPFPLGVGPAGAYCLSLDPDGRRRLEEACFERLGRPAGEFELEARAWAVRGTVPAAD